MSDGSVIVSEVAHGRITRVTKDGKKVEVARPGGGPNGNAVGPDGALYSCNNGGFQWRQQQELLIPSIRTLDYKGGHIDRIDLSSGRVEVLYRESNDGRKLSAPNDIVFDSSGGFWMTDYGSTTTVAHEYGGILYGRADGSSLIMAVPGLLGCNGIGLSPNRKTLYVTLTLERQILAFDIIGPGILGPLQPMAGRVLASFDGRNYLDSMKVDVEGNIVVAVIASGHFATVTTAGDVINTVPVPDLIPTNLCYSGKDLSTAYFLGGTTGKIYRARGQRQGLQLAFQSV
jgi:gluconolactonase